jgi:hypothetical protein
MSHYDVLTSLTLLTLLAGAPEMGMVSFLRRKNLRRRRAQGAGQE